MGKTILTKRVFIIISLLAILISGITTMTQSSTKANAFGACPQVGSFTGQNSVKGDSSSANADSSGRKWTAEELFRKSVSYSSFYGEGDDTWLYAGKADRGKDVKGYEDAKEKFQAARGFSCIMGGFDFVPQVFLGITSGLTGLTSAMITSLVGRDFMSETITSIVGGGDSGEGLITTFLNSFYFPLSIMAFLIMTFAVMYKGLVKRQMRDSLSAILWSLSAFVIGVAFMTAPQVLSSAPQAITSTITSCVIGTLSGQNCLTGDVQTPTILAGDECLSAATGDTNSAESAVNGMNCTIWKSFVLEPWAEEQFGEPYKNLYTKNPPEGGQIWSNLPEDSADKYCVNFASSKSLVESVKGVPNMDSSGSTICNVALYQLFIKTNMKDPVAQANNNFDSDGVMVTDDTGTFDKRWYDIAVPMAGDASKWRNWSGDGMFFSRLSSSVFGTIAVIAASTVLLVLALFGGAYKIIGLIMMAFAPIFLLFAIEPTRGRKIFLGWLETLVSSLLKYFAITVLIVIALVMYAGLLSNTSGVYSLIGVIVLTAALHMYKKEIIDLIGATNMGGQRLSNKFNDVGSKVANQIKQKGQAAAGGFIGGAMAAAGNEDRRERINKRKDAISGLRDALSEATTKEEKERIEGEIQEQENLLSEDSVMETVTRGATDSVERALKRGDGLTGNIFAQMGRTSKELEKIDEQSISDADAMNSSGESLSVLPSLDENNPPNEGNPPNDDGNPPPNALPVSLDKEEKDVHAKVIEREAKMEDIRENVRDVHEYPEELTPEEIRELDKFADNLKNNMNDQELADLANNPALQDDENKKALVANEINARLQANTIVGVASNTLSRTALSNPEFISEEELKFNIQMHAENFLENGSEEELQKYLAAGKELSNRLNLDFDTEQAEEKMKEFRENFDGVYTRKEGIPTEEELKNVKDFEVRINENEVLKSDSVTPPASETVQDNIVRNSSEIAAVRKLDEEIKSKDSNEDSKDPKDPEQTDPKPVGPNSSKDPEQTDPRPIGPNSSEDPEQADPKENNESTTPNEEIADTVQKVIETPTQGNVSMPPLGSTGTNYNYNSNNPLVDTDPVTSQSSNQNNLVSQNDVPNSQSQGYNNFEVSKDDSPKPSDLDTSTVTRETLNRIANEEIEKQQKAEEPQHEEPKVERSQYEAPKVENKLPKIDNATQQNQNTVYQQPPQTQGYDSSSKNQESRTQTPPPQYNNSYYNNSPLNNFDPVISQGNSNDIIVNEVDDSPKPIDQIESRTADLLNNTIDSQLDNINSIDDMLKDFADDDNERK